LTPPRIRVYTGLYGFIWVYTGLHGFIWVIKGLSWLYEGLINPPTSTFLWLLNQLSLGPLWGWLNALEKNGNKDQGVIQ
jgi:hypothetical protein